MASLPSTRNPANPLNVIALILIVAVLYFTRDICVPLILAVLLSFVLSPVVGWLQRSRLPRALSVVLVGTLLLGGLAMGGWLVGGQMVGLAEKLPQYQANVHEKLKSFQTAPGGLMDRLNHTLDSYSREFESIGTQSPLSTVAASTPADATAPAPIAVAVVGTQLTKLAAIERLVLGIIAPLTTVGIVMILSLFMLMRQEDVRDRAIRLLGGGQLQVATQALDDAGTRVSRYLLIQLIVNASFGACIAIGLFALGIPYFFLWGLLAGALRFIPYFGAPIAAVAPLLMAFAATPGWTPVILTLILFVALELTIANVIEPWLYGAHTQISPLAIIASAIFWSWLWGPIGLLLSTPMTVCLVVIGRHVPRLWFLSVLLGDEPVLAPEARFYQRLLAGDQAEAWAIAEKKLLESSQVGLYDSMILPTLILTEQDRQLEALDEPREKFIYQSIRSLLEDLAERPMPVVEAIVPAGASTPESERAAIGAAPGDAPPIAAAIPVVQKMARVLCIPANDEADELAAIMLSHLLMQRGLLVDVVSSKSLAGERLELVNDQLVDVVCVSALPPQALPHARFMCKRLRSRHPTLKLIAALWQPPADPATPAAGLTVPSADEAVFSMSTAVARITSVTSLAAFRADPSPAPPMAPVPVPPATYRRDTNAALH